jgi:hypothetical protein
MKAIFVFPPHCSIFLSIKRLTLKNRCTDIQSIESARLSLRCTPKNTLSTTIGTSASSTGSCKDSVWYYFYYDCTLSASTTLPVVEVLFDKIYNQYDKYCIRFGGPES